MILNTLKAPTHTYLHPITHISLSSTLYTQKRRLRSILSHELGHHFTTSGHHMIAASGLNSVYAGKNERLATKWAVDLMVDTYAFLDCIKNGMDKHGLADYFYVLPVFVEVKGELLRLALYSRRHSRMKKKPTARAFVPHGLQKVLYLQILV